MTDVHTHHYGAWYRAPMVSDTTGSTTDMWERDCLEEGCQWRQVSSTSPFNLMQLAGIEHQPLLNLTEASMLMAFLTRYPALWGAQEAP